MSKIFRKGAVGALLDEYERVIEELKKLIEPIPDSNLTLIIDPYTDNENCRSLQTILSHIVYGGFGNATSIYNSKGHHMVRPDKTFHLSIQEYIQDLTDLFSVTEKVFQDIQDDELLHYEESLKIKTRWGQFYDIEPLAEHAIDHILRHRRHIERLYVMR